MHIGGRDIFFLTKPLMLRKKKDVQHSFFIIYHKKLLSAANQNHECNTHKYTQTHTLYEKDNFEWSLKTNEHF